MKVLITGGAGFIGHNLALFLKEKGYSVTAFDSLERSVESAVKRLKAAGMLFVRGDIRDTNKLAEVLRGSDTIVHCAAYIDVEESVVKPLLYLDNNVLGTVSVAKSCFDAGVRRVVYLSSAAVYGDPVKLPVREDHPLRPLSPYGLSKLLAERVLEFYSAEHGLEVVTLRLFNIYGPGQSGAYAGVVTKFVSKAKASLPLIIFGDGEQTRDFLHVNDACRAIELALSTGHVNEVYNIGSGVATRIKDLAKLIMELTGLKGEPVYAPSRRKDIKHSCADITKAKKLLGFAPRVNLREVIVSEGVIG